MNKSKLCQRLLMQISQLGKAVANKKQGTIKKYTVILNHSVLNDELQVIVHDLYIEAEAQNWRIANTYALVLVNEVTQRSREHYGLLVTNEQKSNYKRMLRNKAESQHFFKLV